MQKLLSKIAEKGLARKNTPPQQSEIIECQKELRLNRIAPIPEDYLVFLHHTNGLSCNDAWLAGIYPHDTQVPDICRLNRQVHHPLSRDLIILGADDFDYLGFNHKWQVYQIIDKDDLEVLEEYQNLEQALNYILKI